MPTLNDIVPGSMKAVTAGKTLYGLPTSNYTQGLIYNRTLFTRAGLDPNSPPTTWAQVEADAKKISALGNGIEGWGDYSAQNTGGWHFSSYIDALGGSMVNNSTAPPSANFDNANGQAVLEALHTLRFTDHAMSATQGLCVGLASAADGPGQARHVHRRAGRHLQRDRAHRQGQRERLRHGPAAEHDRHPGGSLSGGNDYMFAKSDTPAQIKAGIKFIDFEDLTPGKGQFNFARIKADGQPVGFPEPELFQGAAGDEDQRICGPSTGPSTPRTTRPSSRRTRTASASRSMPRLSTTRSTR